MENPELLQKGDVFALSDMFRNRGRIFYRGHQFEVYENSPVSKSIKVQPLRVDDRSPIILSYREIKQKFTYIL